MSDDFFSPAGKPENPQAARDPREYPIPEDWLGKQSTPPSSVSRRRRSPHPGAVLLILVGVLFFLNNTGIVHIGSVFSYWPVILIVIGVSQFGCSRGRPEALVPLVVGVIFLLHNLGVLSLSFGLLWPIGLIIIGFIFLINHSGGVSRSKLAWKMPQSMQQQSTDERELHLFSFFGGVKRVMDTDDFRGGEAMAIFGGVEVDLRLAQMSGAVTEVVVTANALFGGINIRVPENWRVAVRGMGIFGGYEDKTLRRKSDVSPNSPLLVITGSAVFGGIEVKS